MKRIRFDGFAGIYKTKNKIAHSHTRHRQRATKKNCDEYKRIAVVHRFDWIKWTKRVLCARTRNNSRVKFGGAYFRHWAFHMCGSARWFAQVEAAMRLSRSHLVIFERHKSHARKKFVFFMCIFRMKCSFIKIRRARVCVCCLFTAECSMLNVRWVVTVQCAVRTSFFSQLNLHILRFFWKFEKFKLMQFQNK